MTYIANPVPWISRQAVPPTDPEVATFVVTRLAELVIVLFRDHVRHDQAALMDRAEGQVVLLALGDTAAEHGCPELLPILHRMAAMIDTPNRICRETTRATRSPAAVTYHW